jgi:DNA-binding transcriptional regulator YdaS (Cro superfamily)
MTGGLDMENPSCPELVAWLKEESFTKADLAKLIGVTHQAINRFLLGKAYLHPKNEMAIVAPTKGEVGYADLRPYLKGGKVGPNGLVKPLAVPRKEKKVDADGNG